MNLEHKSRLSKDESLFVRGPLSRFKELLFSFKVQYNFIKAFRKMHFVGLVLPFLALLVLPKKPNIIKMR